MAIKTESIAAGLRAQLRELVAGAEVGDRLPSERELSVRLGAARMTVRRAIDGLVAEGLVERRQGSGTYVTLQPIERLLSLTSFSQEMRDRGLVPGSRTLAFHALNADKSLAAQLRIPVGTRVLSFTRLRLGTGAAMAVESVWIPAALVPGITASDLDGSLYELLASRYHISLGAARVTIEPVNPDEYVRALLTLDERQACLRICMVDSDINGRVVMIANCVYRGDKYQLAADIPGPTISSLRTRRVA